jgi:hypothetical protein
MLGAEKFYEASRRVQERAVKAVAQLLVAVRHGCEENTAVRQQSVQVF